jgi:hypothetical protein
MIIDAQNRYSNAQAITSAAASTNIIDHGAVRDLGTGENLYVVVVVTTLMADDSSNSTITVKLQTSADDSTFGTDAQTLGTFAAVSAAGTMIIARLAPGAINLRYSRLYYTPANGDLSGGAFTAFLCHDIAKFVAYPDNITIS